MSSYPFRKSVLDSIGVDVHEESTSEAGEIVFHLGSQHEGPFGWARPEDLRRAIAAVEELDDDADLAIRYQAFHDAMWRRWLGERQIVRSPSHPVADTLANVSIYVDRVEQRSNGTYWRIVNHENPIGWAHVDTIEAVVEAVGESWDDEDPEVPFYGFWSEMEGRWASLVGEA